VAESDQFKWPHNQSEIILLCLRWYLRYALSYRDLEETMRLTTQIPLILQLDEWRHPDLANDELPGENPTFRMIAEVLITGDRSIYQPQKPPNTRRSNWPEGETL